MRQAPARKTSDAYLDAPRRSERPHLRVVEDLRVEVPLVEVPDWAEPFADPRWDDRLGSPDYEERDGRRTVVVTGRPAGKAVPRRDSVPGGSARMRRQTPTRARLAGRPDRVALWAVALALLMAGMAAFTGNGHHGSGSGSAHDSPEPSPAQLLGR